MTGIRIIKDQPPPAWFQDENYSYLNDFNINGWFNEILRCEAYQNGWEQQKEELRPILGNKIYDFIPGYVPPPAVRLIETIDDMMEDDKLPERKKLVGPYITVRLYLSSVDDVLENEVCQIIKEQRQVLGIQSKGTRPGKKSETAINARFTENHFMSWRTHKIIQLHDLEYWAHRNSTKITAAQLGKWLFPKSNQPSKEINKARKILKEVLASIPALAMQSNEWLKKEKAKRQVSQK